jgi:hypothetical protein
LTVVAFDPGLMPGTGLARDASATLLFVWHHVLPRLIWLLKIMFHGNVHTPKESGENLAWVAISADVKEETGVYFEMRKTIPSSVDSHDEKKQDDLWDWTIKNVSTSEEERQKFDIGK